MSETSVRSQSALFTFSGSPCLHLEGTPYHGVTGAGCAHGCWSPSSDKHPSVWRWRRAKGLQTIGLQACLVSVLICTFNNHPVVRGHLNNVFHNISRTLHAPLKEHRFVDDTSLVIFSPFHKEIVQYHHKEDPFLQCLCIFRLSNG